MIAMRKYIYLLVLLCALFSSIFTFSQTTVKKVILQGFWWDYTNNNFTNSWANYLTELAPRLKQMGIDAVWIPPSTKGGSGTYDVGYGVFDNYDLGDKFQKGNVRTRVGSKDEVLRMIAVLHANGIEVIQDVVPNQLGGAGDLSTGGYDPLAVTNNKYKNFRYTSFIKPATTQANAADSATEYLTRNGRFFKNWQNFHNNPAHNGCESTPGDNWCQELFGPDICYYDDAYGQSSNAVFNPTQTGGVNNGYMRRGMRDWLTWLKKQTAFDGIRLDAAKHYEYTAAEDWLYNLQQSALFANGTDSMIAVGEYVGNISEMDIWCNNVQNRAGTFDFNFRSGIKSMVDAGGFYNMADLPAAQQNNRVQYYGGINAYVHRTIPFVNNHDTYRPILDALGNVTGWDSGSELAPHIDPINNTRLVLAYAALMAIDGNPQIFFEDLFNIYNTSKRYTHLPGNVTDLPSNAAIQNLVACHQKLQFKNGAYKVRSTAAGGNVFFNGGSSANDLLIIERSNKALIGLNDRGDGTWQSAYVDSDFPAGTVLKDYSGANGTATYTVPADKRVNVNTPPVDPANNRWGYSIWAPVGFDAVVYEPTRNKRTTQEWEMADDLGDSHCNSLGYGGALPANSTNQRVVGKIFSAANQVVNASISSATSPSNILLSIWDLNGNKLAENIGTTPIAYTPATDGWLTIKIRHNNTSTPSQNVFVKIDYQAPQVVNTLATSNNQNTKIAIWTGNKGTTDITDCGNWEEAKMPSATTDVLIPANASPFPVFNTDVAVNNIIIENGASLQINNGKTLSVNGNWINNNSGPLSVCGKVAFTGASLQQLYGQNTFCVAEVNNPSSVNAQNNNIVNDQLILTNGKYILNTYNLTLQSTCNIIGGNAGAYVQCANAPTGGFLIQQINSSTKFFPLGNADYTPISIVNNGTVQNCNVRCFEDVLANGLSGSSVTSTEKIKKTWEITPAATGAVADIVLNWNTSNHDIGFNAANCFVAKNTGGAGASWQQIGTQSAATGSNPYSKTVTGISSFSKFTLFSNIAVLPVKIIAFTGTAKENKATLNWKVGTEDNMLKYQIEKSIDGRFFYPVGEVAASAKENYAFTDNNFLENSYYRLVMINLDGKISYSDIIIIHKENRQTLFTVWPNPVSDYIRIKASGLNNTETVTLQLFNSAAVKMLETKGNIDTVEKNMNRQLGKLMPGMYYLKISTNYQTQIIKIVKK